MKKIEERLTQFIKPEFLPTNEKALQAWVDEAEDNAGMVEASVLWTISGHTELFRL